MALTLYNTKTKAVFKAIILIPYELGMSTTDHGVSKHELTLV